MESAIKGAIMRRIGLISSIAAALLLEACTTPVGQGEANAPARGRVLSREFQETSNGNSAIVLSRDKETIPSGCGITITIDQRPIVVLDAGEAFTAHLRAGDHKLGAQYAQRCAGRPGSMNIATHTGQAQAVRVRYSVTEDVFTSAGETALAQATQ